mmetsp:Transcript_7656/g.8916  ORF Transcript_7656/g.8916 Transcript_7656/m.8916 type:complete len:80 (+) Transcript_7656:352-591(+)
MEKNLPIGCIWMNLQGVFWVPMRCLDTMFFLILENKGLVLLEQIVRIAGGALDDDRRMEMWGYEYVYMSNTLVGVLNHG